MSIGREEEFSKPRKYEISLVPGADSRLGIKKLQNCRETD
jgi:hypothetical protein